MAERNAEGNHKQEVGYRPPQSVSDENQDQPGSNAFPSEQQQKQAAQTNKVQYSAASDASDVGNGPGTGPTMSGQFGGTTSTARNPNANAAAGAAQDRSTPLRDDNASSPGLAPDRAGTYPGPGTATDRGTGNVGSTPFGTGVSDNGFESTSGLDERDTSSMNSANYNGSDTVGTPNLNGGVTGSGIPSLDNQSSEMGTGEGDFSTRPTDTGASSR
jgi:hypothetical protein